MAQKCRLPMNYLSLVSEETFGSQGLKSIWGFPAKLGTRVAHE